ncbi:Metallo-hydrolase/oxidoreductase [Phellopilus nigrolimitatus]|nr:Metallo-hydrolase/oxidoreductase [Phellopilus nigrolimitatus]
MSAARKKTAAFTAARLTSTVFKIVEYDDIYEEHPYIYAKLLPSVLLLIDSGCGGASNDPNVDVTSLREFVETWPVEDNDDAPLNEHGKRKYVVVCTHCHYDHILALEQFATDSLILASSHSPSFLSPTNLPKNTQCKRLGIPVPRYTPELVAHETLISFEGASTGLRVLHTPGHTPDELALWDAGERMLYVGDTVYEWEPVLFPPEGDLVVWFASMDYLVDFVRAANREREDTGRFVRINAGHDTSMGDALDVLLAGRAFVMDVLTGKERVKRRSEVDGVRLVYYAQRDGRFSLRLPEELVWDARDEMKIPRVV